MELVFNRDLEEARRKAPLEFIFLPGAGLRGWIWKGIQERLSYPSIAIEFLNVDTQSSLDDYEISAIKQIEQSKLSKKIIVAHSGSGGLGLRLAAAVGAQLVGFVGIAAVIPRRGGSYLSTLPPIRRFLMKTSLKLSTRPPDKIIQRIECNDLDDSLTEEVVKRFHPESSRYFEDECGALPPPVHRLYFKLLNDVALRPSVQDQMIQNFAPTEVKEFSTGHLAMLKEPGHLARVLDLFADERLNQANQRYRYH